LAFGPHQRAELDESSKLVFTVVCRFTMSNTTNVSIVKLSIRSDSSYRDITIRLTERSMILILWLGFGTVLLYEILSVWVLFLLRRYQRRPTADSSSSPERDEETGNDSEPLPFLITRKTESAQEPNRLIVLVWGISTAYAIFYSFEIIFLYLNDRWYQLLGIQVLLTASDILTWIQLIACCKYGIAPCYPMTQVCVSIKLLHVLFNIFMESRESITSARHWMFLFEDTTYLWCSKYWLQAQPRKLLSVKGVGFLLLAASSCALLMHNLTSMNRITRV
jgi:hypothetical protein